MSETEVAVLVLVLFMYVLGLFTGFCVGSVVEAIINALKGNRQ